MDDSAIMCDEIKDADAEAKLNNEAKRNNDETKKKLMKKKATCKTENFYILLVLLIITIAFLIPVRIYCYLLKHQVKQLLPFHYTNNELREVSY